MHQVRKSIDARLVAMVRQWPMVGVSAPSPPAQLFFFPSLTHCLIGPHTPLRISTATLLRLPLRRAKNLRFFRTRKALSHLPGNSPTPSTPPRVGFYPLFFSTFSYHHQHHKLFGVRSVEQTFPPSSSYHCFFFSFPIPFGLFSVWVFDLKAASFVSLNPLIP